MIAVSYFVVLHRETRLLMCFTNAAKYDVEQTLDKIDKLGVKETLKLEDKSLQDMVKLAEMMNTKVTC